MLRLDSGGMGAEEGDQLKCFLVRMVRAWTKVATVQAVRSC